MSSGIVIFFCKIKVNYIDLKELNGGYVRILISNVIRLIEKSLNCM